MSKKRYYRMVHKKRVIVFSVFLKKLKYSLFMRKKSLIWMVLSLEGKGIRELRVCEWAI